MKYRSWFIFCLLMLGSALSGFGQAKRTLSICLVVAANDEYKDLLTSYFRRELDSLRDVEVNLDNCADPDFRLVIGSVPIKSNGIPQGLAFATVLSERRTLSRQFLSKEIDKSGQDALVDYFANAVRLLDSGIFVCSRDSLKKNVEEIVAGYDLKIDRLRQAIKRSAPSK